MKESHLPRVGISIGDLNGIGSEIILKTFEDTRMFDFCIPVVFANAKLMNFFKKTYGSKTLIHSTASFEELHTNKLNVYNAWEESVSVNFGKEDSKIGSYAFKSLDIATKALQENLVDVLVTAPIHKNTIQSDQFQFKGHTDFLNDKLEGNSIMLMVSDALKVALLTDHVPLNEITKNLTPGSISEKISLINNSMIKDFGIPKPKIAVLGINPHTGDNGVIGHEDDEILKPTLKKLQQAGKLIYGPYAADSFFGNETYKQFDVTVACYHDQGLIGFKTLAFGKGTNFTAGLSKIRTSPDHGTAFEIAGKKLANHQSFKEALFKALEIFRNRKDYEQYAQNKLKKASEKTSGKSTNN